jgi:hypothetical protein
LGEARIECCFLGEEGTVLAHYEAWKVAISVTQLKIDWTVVGASLGSRSCPVEGDRRQ